MTRHKWADVAEAFGNRKVIQYKDVLGAWVNWNETCYPEFYEHHEWRIKPDEPEFVDLYLFAIQFNDGIVLQTPRYYATGDKAKEGYANVVGVFKLENTKITVQKLEGKQ